MMGDTSVTSDLEQYYIDIIKEKEQETQVLRWKYERLKEKEKQNEKKIQNQKNEIKELEKKVKDLNLKLDERYALDLEKDQFILEREERLTRITKMLAESLNYIKVLEKK